MSDPFHLARADVNQLLGDLQKVRRTQEPLLTRRKEPTKNSKKESTVKKESPVLTYVRSLKGEGAPYLTASEVATALDISVQAVRKYGKMADLKAPSYTVPFGNIVIHLYTKQDVEEIRHYLSARRKVVPNKKG